MMIEGAASSPSRDLHPLTLFANVKSRGETLNVSAPMVRYSKLPFRLLVQDYHVHLTYTPMMLAHEFIRHPRARDSDFSTHADEGPLIAQFAASEPTELARAAVMIAPWVNGVDLNCGCPQSWAVKEGLGCSLMARPELVRDMVVETKQALQENGFDSRSVSIKIRIHPDIKQTIAFLRCVLEPGQLDYVTVHARTRSQRSSTPPDLVALAQLKAAFPEVCMVANGDVYTAADAVRIVKLTGVEGVMAARGILENPALFAGYDLTPVEAVHGFLGYALRSGMRYELVVHHLNEMTAKSLSKRRRKGLLDARDYVDIVDWLDGALPSGAT